MEIQCVNMETSHNVVSKGTCYKNDYPVIWVQVFIVVIVFPLASPLEQFWDAPKSLANGYQEFSPRKCGWCMKPTTQLRLVLISITCESIHPLPRMPSWRSAKLSKHKNNLTVVSVSRTATALSFSNCILLHNFAECLWDLIFLIIEDLLCVNQREWLDMWNIYFYFFNTEIHLPTLEKEILQVTSGILYLTQIWSLTRSSAQNPETVWKELDFAMWRHVVYCESIDVHE